MARSGTANMQACRVAISLLSVLMIVCLFPSAGGGLIGVNYGRTANNLPSALHVVKLIQKEGFKKVKIFDADNSTIRAFADTGIDLIVGVPNDQLPSIAKSFDRALIWVKENVSHHIPATRISAITVGNEVLTSSPELSDYLVPAMKNVYSALKQLKLNDRVKVSSPHALAILSSTFPPSASTFQANLTHKIMRPMFEFLNQTNSYAMVNVYPFYAYKANPKDIPLNYAIFQSRERVHDSKTKLNYTNLFDAMLDSWFFAMKRLGFVDLKVVVTESGWPSKGDHNEPGCTLKNAAAYNHNLVKHIISKKGSPFKPKVPIETYIFALFNENLKPGPTSERNYGLMRPSGKKVYEFDLNPKHNYHVSLPPSKPHHRQAHGDKQHGTDGENEGTFKSSTSSLRLQRADYNVYFLFHLIWLAITFLALPYTGN